MPGDRPDYVDAADAARIVGLTVGHLRALVERRHAPPPTQRELGRPLWLRTDLEQWRDRRLRADW